MATLYIALSDNLQGFLKDFSTCSITNAYKKYIGAFAIEIAPAENLSNPLCVCPPTLLTNISRMLKCC